MLDFSRRSPDIPGTRILLVRDLRTMTDRTARQDETVAAETDNATAPETADPVAEAKSEAAEFKDKMLRTVAEMENLRKRTEREVIDARVYGIAGFARDVLAVADNMHRALEAIGPDLRDADDPKVKALIEGVELTERELMKILEKNGVRKFSPHGEKFDPNVHQAMYEVPTSDLPPGQVAQVIQAGYMIGDRVLRPALVAVSKAAPQAPASAHDNPQPYSASPCRCNGSRSRGVPSGSARMPGPICRRGLRRRWARTRRCQSATIVPATPDRPSVLCLGHESRGPARR